VHMTSIEIDSEVEKLLRNNKYIISSISVTIYNAG
jgi:hypothetical protein